MTCSSGQFPHSQDSFYALYLHIPFCTQKCGYCDFASWPYANAPEARTRYVASLERDLVELSELGLLEDVQTAYIGGGTPSCLEHGLVKLIHTVGKFCNPREFSSEANPESTTKDLLEELAQTQLTRLSFGVQSLHERELKSLGRTHTNAEALTCIRTAKKMGFDVSSDLMCAIPYQTPASWFKSLKGCVDAGVDHISAYPLAIEPHTAFWHLYAKKNNLFNSDLVQKARMEACERILKEQGFHRYEVSSYAKPGKSCLHNIAYWTHKSYIGVGVSAASMMTRSQYERLRTKIQKFPSLDRDIYRVRMTVRDSRKAYCSAQGLINHRYELEAFTRSQALAEDMMLEARLARGIEYGLIHTAEDVFGREVIQQLIDEIIHLGLATWRTEQMNTEPMNIESMNTRLCPTHTGWLMGNYLYERLWDLAEGSPSTYTLA